MINKRVHILILISFLFLLSSFLMLEYQKKIIRNKDFDHHIYVLTDLKKTSKDKNYYWFKSGDIQSSFGESGGHLLHKQYLKYYPNNDLAEKGNFNKGLKVGVWKSWYKDGTLREIINYINGSKNGSYKYYDENGNLELKGYFKNDKKHNKWINIKSKDTIWYKNGLINHKLIEKRKKRDSISKTKEIKTKKNIISKFFKKLFKGDNR